MDWTKLPVGTELRSLVNGERRWVMEGGVVVDGDGTEVMKFGSACMLDFDKMYEVVEAGNTDANGEGKQTNPKDIIGSRKLPFSVLPWRVLCGVALAMLEGAAKYGRHNYRAAGVRASVYFDACVGRHLTSWWEGEDIDPDSGRHHIDKAIAGLMVLRDSQLQGNFNDDRPPVGNVDMPALNAEAERIIGLHADKHPRHFTIKDSQ